MQLSLLHAFLIPHIHLHHSALQNLLKELLFLFFSLIGGRSGVYLVPSLHFQTLAECLACIKLSFSAFLLMNVWLYRALAPAKHWYEDVWTLVLYRESSALGKRSYINQVEQIILGALANAIKPLSNCLTLARDENIDEMPLNCLGWGLLKWAITAVNNPLLVLSTVFSLSRNAEWSGKCCGNSVAFNLLIWHGKSHSLTWLWQQ